MPTLSPRRRMWAAPLCAAIALTSLMLASPAGAQEVAISDAARTHFSAGVRLLQDPGGARYEEAYQEFRVAYADSPSPRILGNMGLCAMKLERDEEAINAFERYLAQSPKLDPNERKQIESDLRTLRASLVRVTLAVTTPDVRIVDVRTPVQGASVTNVYGPLPPGSIQLGIHPGHHIITVKREGYVPASWEIDALPSAALSHPFTLQPIGGDPRVAPPPSAPVAVPPPAPFVPPTPADDGADRPTPKAVWALTALSAAFGVAGAITGAVAISKRDSYNSINDGTRSPDAEALRASGVKLNAATDVLLGTAVVGAVVTVIVYATRPKVPVVTTGVGLARRSASGIFPAPSPRGFGFAF